MCEQIFDGVTHTNPKIYLFSALHVYKSITRHKGQRTAIAKGEVIGRAVLHNQDTGSTTVPVPELLTTGRSRDIKNFFIKYHIRDLDKKGSNKIDKVSAHSKQEAFWVELTRVYRKETLGHVRGDLVLLQLAGGHFVSPNSICETLLKILPEF